MKPFIFHPGEHIDRNLFLSFEHLMALYIFGGFVILLFLFRHHPFMRQVRWILFATLVISEIGIVTWSILTGLWDIQYNLPLHLCTISLVTSSFMLATNSYKVFEIIYFFGVGGAFQAIITPELFYTFPHFRFFHYFIAHFAIILAIFYMIWVCNYTVKFRSAFKAFLVLNCIAAVAITVNHLTGANYMFLARKPVTPSILDWLGPYPWYILSLELLAIILFLLLCVPFYLRQRQ
ncbi:TIGR02206 family membrane protein [Anaerobacillus alkaliphilus]|uniref:TIGR02206 family membrane protein n=1 Tax=Anaerobacillus alkaliphilus TaxID=1548597 RepID=A0A4Q0VYE6_9BACI|nr:TIGR02206 family membrane protein [Anaerobacillus alkaliphilus]RXJ04206.1 TIGR02206 family membrane protein [Anaerobacillus alkaliphilus]